MAAPKNPKPGAGKKSVPWQEDPEILKRLATVEDLVLACYRNTEIAKSLEVSEATIRRDRERIATLWREQATSDIVAMRERSIANLRRLQRLADNEFRNKRDPTANLRVQLDAEKEVIKLQGTSTPVEQAIRLTNIQEAVESLSTDELLKRAAALEEMANKLLSQAEESQAEGL